MNAGKVSSRALGKSALKGHISIEATPCPHPSTKLRETSSSEPLPPDQPRVAIPLSYWCRRYDDDTHVPCILSRCPESRTIGLRHHRPQKKKSEVFKAYLCDRVEPRHRLQPYHTPRSRRKKRGGGTTSVESTLVRWLILEYPRNRHACWKGFQLCFGQVRP